MRWGKRFEVEKTLEQMKLILDGKPYTVKLNENKTVRDILDMLPLTLHLQRRRL